ncbi:ABC transporter ATP-binding protein [Ileibacterium valens]|uniref:ABC transporter ATP-binding protein n=1 Tax=Ileibacterium valens TaxID=1862668 RepID=UPI00272D7655|nr:ABC transporter ATP-binding protein [Ileibacterium valens]
MNILEVSNLQKIYKSRFSASSVEALKNVSFNVAPGEFVAIMGESGSGKTTLLNILATLDEQTQGEVRINGVDASSMKGHELSSFRRNHLGFVFQDFSLLDTFSNEDNILLPLVLDDRKLPEMKQALAQVSKALGIQDILKKFPYEVSGGQKQRVAVARALITNPELLLADEPTGALDSKSSQEMLEVFEKINQLSQTILMVTHSTSAASYASRVLFIRDGEIFHQIYRGNLSRQDFFDQITKTISLMAARNEDKHA